MTRKIYYSIFFISFLISTICFADETFTFVVKKQEEKAKNRWSLSEWLDTRDRMRMMDLWLQFHSPSPYEFYLGGAAEFGQKKDQGTYSGGIGYLAGYASIVGLEVQKEQSAASFLTGIFHLRIFGYHAQATNLTLQGGLRYRGDLSTGFRMPFAGVSLTLYITKFFGIDGLYRNYFLSNTDSSGTRLKGTRYEAGAFIDFRFLRLYGNFFHEQEVASNELTQGNFPIRSETSAGIRFFF
ncbi:MAG: hypothetical protein AB7F43_00645 [Bacteriovoracia bacterium]